MHFHLRYILTSDVSQRTKYCLLSAHLFKVILWVDIILSPYQCSFGLSLASDPPASSQFCIIGQETQFQIADEGSSVGEWEGNLNRYMRQTNKMHSILQFCCMLYFTYECIQCAIFWCHYVCVWSTFLVCVVLLHGPASGWPAVCLSQHWRRAAPRDRHFLWTPRGSSRHHCYQPSLHLSLAIYHRLLHDGTHTLYFFSLSRNTQYKIMTVMLNACNFSFYLY